MPGKRFAPTLRGAERRGPDTIISEYTAGGLTVRAISRFSGRADFKDLLLEASVKYFSHKRP